MTRSDNAHLTSDPKLKPHERWELLKAKGPTIEEIDAIDKDTPWAPVEPDWWLEMMQVRRRLVGIK